MSRTIDEAKQVTATRMQAVWGRGSVVVLCSLLTMSSNAFACRTADNHRTIFFNEVPSSVTSQIIAEVTITKIIGPPEYTLPDGTQFSYVGIARVDRVTKGSLDLSERIRIKAPNSDCDIPFRVGSTGTVFGKLEAYPDGTLELKALSGYVDPEMRKQFPDWNSP